MNGFCKCFATAAVLALASVGAAHAEKYDIAAYVWPAYQPEPRWGEMGIYAEGKGEWQNVWEAVPKWEGTASRSFLSGDTRTRPIPK